MFETRFVCFCVAFCAVEFADMNFGYLDTFLNNELCVCRRILPLELCFKTGRSISTVAAFLNYVVSVTERLIFFGFRM